VIVVSGQKLPHFISTTVQKYSIALSIATDAVVITRRAEAGSIFIDARRCGSEYQATVTAISSRTATTNATTITRFPFDT
jgi:hypothetical protein